MEFTEGVINAQSPFAVDETTNRLVVFLEQHGITVYARINQQNELLKTGLQARPMEFILFGNPATGGQIILSNPVAALDLPLKMLIWKDDHDVTWVTYNDSGYIGKRYKLNQALISSIDLSLLLKSALKKEESFLDLMKYH